LAVIRRCGGEKKWCFEGHVFSWRVMNASPRILALIGSLSLGVSVLAAEAPAKAEPPATLQALKEKQAATKAATALDYSGRIAKTKDWYVTQLDVLQKDLTARGDLDGVLAAKTEKERMDRALSPDERRALPASVNALRGKYDQAIDQLAATQKVTELASVRDYATALDALQKRLTQKGDLDAALLVKSERDSVATELVLLESTRTPPPAVGGPSTPAPVATSAPVARVAAPSPAPRFFDKKPDPNSPVGTWDFVSLSTKSGIKYARIFKEDGTFTGDNFVGTGKWKLSEGKIIMTFPNGRKGFLNLPLVPSGTRAQAGTGDPMMATRQSP